MEYLQYIYRTDNKIRKGVVLNLIINGIPSIPKRGRKTGKYGGSLVLNLIINGIPSIPQIKKSVLKAIQF